MTPNPSYTDALVVTLSVANGKVFHILIDTGSSADVLFSSSFLQMNVGGTKTRPITTRFMVLAEKGFTPKEPFSCL